MSEVPSLLGLTVLILAYGLLPGTAALCLLRVRPPARADRLLAAAGLSVTLIGWAVFFLLLAGAYRRWTAAALLALPAAYLFVLAARRDERLRLLTAPSESPARLTLADRVAVAGCSALIALAFVEALTSPPTWWDATIHWDKWAADWGRRSDLYGYRYGYPQLLPMFCSVVYKTTGSSSDVLPVSAFALHGAHPLFGAALLVALVRLAALFQVPAWPLLVLVFGMKTLHTHLAAGGADLFLTALCSTAVVVFLAGLKRRPEPSWKQVAVAAVLFSGAASAKATGLLALAAALSMLVSYRRWPPPGAEPPRVSTASMWAIAGLTGLLALPSYGWALYAERTVDLPQLDPRETHYPVTAMPGELVKAAERARPIHGGALDQVWAIVSRPIADCGVPGVLIPAVLGLVLVILGGAWADRRSRGLVPPLLAYVAAWGYMFSYDVRNLLPAIPLLGVGLACGARHVGDALLQPRARTLGVLVAGAALAFPALGLLDRLSARALDLVRGPLSMATRLRALGADADEKIKVFFPDVYDDYAFLRHTGLDRRATHVNAASPLYRWFPNGAYLLSLFWWGHLKPGDVHVAPPWVSAWLPSYDFENWTLVQSRADWRFFVYDPGAKRIPLSSLWVTGVNPPSVRQAARGRLAVRFQGRLGMLVYNALLERPAPGSSVLWQLVAEGDSLDDRIQPITLPYDPAIIDRSRTTLLAAVGPARTLTYSGLVTLTDHPLSTDWRDGLLLGAASDARGPKLRVREFRVSVQPPLPAS